MYMSGVSNKLGHSDDYGFIDPQSVHESNDFEHINMSLIRSFGRGKKIYFLPYISGRHWQLLVMSMQDNYALWFCSLHRPPPTQLKQAIDCTNSGIKSDRIRNLVKFCDAQEDASIRNEFKKLEEKILKQKAEARPSSEDGIPQPPSPPSRHEKWKLAHLRSSGAYSSDTAREISKRIEQEHVMPPIGRSGKGSCSASTVPGDDMDNASPCLLYILDGTGMMLVARGTVFQAATVIHGMELSEDEVKVSIDDIIIPDASVPLPKDEIFTMEQTFQSFIVWSKHLVGSISDPPRFKTPTPILEKSFTF
ncbi:hypothetical protein LR48_Vigan10g124800 [Vigna angularis]|uniref:DUF8039 domain-containing protein n=1 Tax=Phaseolus angularis TaxID=3914 RepID=A0A0L9VJX8_PHAAN|nr:hypothetical protein LR48_Vigan10g124800 [Vigna angularis]